MTTVTTSAAPIKEGKFDIKSLVMMIVVAIIISYVVSRVMKSTVTLVDANGNVIGTGRIETSLNIGTKPSAATA